MKVHSYERSFLAVGAFGLLACIVALSYATFGMGMHLPDRVAKVEPRNIRTTAPFDHPGVRKTGPNEYEAVVLAQIWTFSPAEIRVPAGSHVTFTVTSADVIHGFDIVGTRINMMAIPGQISRNSYTFREPGEHLLICHEYCGAAHHTMFAKVIVE
ncbi:MAG: cytochrome c oxidase subunit II [Gemmatimonas sp.]|nr:cytochrome c oxidase subunit II [Gemmatimonadaceae bacterium]